eukprot:m.309475 g.309475  ORF g.309475 m.309475 type:complete len:581 (-) comp16473_c0_seq45:4437-6179(-)
MPVAVTFVRHGTSQDDDIPELLRTCFEFELYPQTDPTPATQSQLSPNKLVVSTVQLKDGKAGNSLASEKYDWNCSIKIFSGSEQCSTRQEFDMAIVYALPISFTENNIKDWLGPVTPLISAVVLINDSSRVEKGLLIRFIDTVRQTPFFYVLLKIQFSQSSSLSFVKLYAGQFFQSEGSEFGRVAFVSSLSVVRESHFESFAASNDKMFELPWCPRCLERLDENTPPLSVCFGRISGDLRPSDAWVSERTQCRVCQTVENQKSVSCIRCQATERIWVCMVCGLTGCSRRQFGEEGNKKGHALEHCSETNMRHRLVLQLDPLCVWDYCQDRYIHRAALEPPRIANEASGRLGKDVGARPPGLDQTVEYSHGETAANGDSWNHNGDFGLQKFVDHSKRESIALEYVELLSNQLESQKRYFLDRIHSIQCRAAEEKSKLETDVASLGSECELLEKQIQEQERSSLEVSKHLDEKRNAFAGALKDMQLQRSRSANFIAKQNEWKSLMSTKKKEHESTMREMQEELSMLEQQVSDIREHIAKRDEIAKAPESLRKEIQEGHLATMESPQNSGVKQGRKRPGSRRK